MPNYLPPEYDPVLKMYLPSGLRGDQSRMAQKVTTWDMTGQQIINEAMRNIEPGMVLEIRGGLGRGGMVISTLLFHRQRNAQCCFNQH